MYSLIFCTNSCILWSFIGPSPFNLEWILFLGLFKTTTYTSKQPVPPGYDFP